MVKYNLSHSKLKTLEDIDFTKGDTKWLEIIVSHNELTKLLKIEKLTALICHDNKLISIPPSETLEVLECQYNNISSLDLNTFPSLTHLIVDGHVKLDGLEQFINKDGIFLRKLKCWEK